ncbi:MAG TPA: hypothetical protein VNB90_04720 [Cytophagaceae bacterium]|nr:hypothetical protein [Cytophagaceae bacterium]
MDLFTINPDDHFLLTQEENDFNSYESGNHSNATAMSFISEEQEQYYKESIIINYQRYKALFRSKLMGNILIDDKNIIRDFNKTAREDFDTMLGKYIRIGSSITDWFETPFFGPVFQKILQSGLNEIFEFEFVGPDGVAHTIRMEILLFISPSENRLLKCISTIKIR